MPFFDALKRNLSFREKLLKLEIFLIDLGLTIGFWPESEIVEVFVHPYSDFM